MTSKTSYLLLVTAVCALACSSSGQSLLNEQFSGSSLDSNRWTQSIPFSDSSISITGGLLVTGNGGGLLSKAMFASPIEVTFAFAFTGSSFDSFRLYTRADEFNSNGYGVRHGVGVSFRIQEDTGNLTGNIALEDSGVVLAAGTVAISKNRYLTVRLVDTGTLFRVYLDNATTPFLTSTTTSAHGNRIALFNREGSGHGSTISAGSMVSVDYLNVTVLPTPVITSISPRRQIVALGENLTLAVTATSDTPLSYQWKRNGLPIAGATGPSYTINNAAANRDAGRYQAEVSNSAGTVVSAVVFVNVNVTSANIIGFGINNEGQTNVPSELTSIVALATFRHSLAVRSNGTVVAWGPNGDGQTTVPANLSDVVAVAVGLSHSLALKSDSTVVAWGGNSYGQTTVPAGLSNVVAISTSGIHSLALKSDGTVIAWGYNGEGRATVPTNLTDVVAISAGGSSLAMKSNSSLVAWGDTILGSSGMPSNLGVLSAISGGGNFTSALKADLTVAAWGYNGYGQTNVPPSLTNVVAIGTGDNFAVALRADGTLVAWGHNSVGQTAVPPNLDKAVMIAVGGSHTLVLRNAAGETAPLIANQPVPQTARLGQKVSFSVTVTAGTATVAYQWRKDGVNIAGATSHSYAIDPLTLGANGDYDVVVSNFLGVSQSTAALLTIDPAPYVTRQPVAVALPVGQSASLSVTSAGSPTPTYQWRKNGSDIPSATNAIISIPSLQPADAALYDTVVSNASGTIASSPAIVGVSTITKLVGAGTEVGSDIPHANGNIFDQILLQGIAASYRADSAQNQITRLSYIDLTNDIVQVEFSGAGTVSIVLEGSSGPATAVNYNQDSVSYMKGHAGIVVTGANETTNLSVFSVGRGNAVNQALFKDNVTYDGVADISFIAIQSTNGKFGGLRTANASFWNTQGYTGIYAPSVQFTGPVYVHDINAQQDATPVLMLGSALGNTWITGGDLEQANGRAVQVSGLTQLKFADGASSHYVTTAPVAAYFFNARTNKAVLQRDGVDVTAQIVVNP